MRTHEVQGYVLALDKIIHITKVFEASEQAGFQYNVRLLGPTVLEFRYPDRATAVLKRDLLIRALETI